MKSTCPAHTWHCTVSACISMHCLVVTFTASSPYPYMHPYAPPKTIHTESELHFSQIYGIMYIVREFTCILSSSFRYYIRILVSCYVPAHSVKQIIHIIHVFGIYTYQKNTSTHIPNTYMMQVEFNEQHCIRVSRSLHKNGGNAFGGITHNYAKSLKRICVRFFFSNTPSFNPSSTPFNLRQYIGTHLKYINETMQCSNMLTKWYPAGSSPWNE